MEIIMGIDMETSKRFTGSIPILFSSAWFKTDPFLCAKCFLVCMHEFLFYTSSIFMSITLPTADSPILLCWLQIPPYYFVDCRFLIPYPMYSPYHIPCILHILSHVFSHTQPYLVPLRCPVNHCVFFVLLINLHMFFLYPFFTILQYMIFFPLIFYLVPYILTYFPSKPSYFWIYFHVLFIFCLTS